MDDVARQYEFFARVGAHNVSHLYEEWALGIADDDVVRSLIAALPAERQIPNLIFASARLLGVPLGAYAQFRDWLVENFDAVREVAMVHSTQTNEAARCGTLLPQLSTIEGPIALLEVGTSAGLCLYPDRYSYLFHEDDGDTRIDPAAGPSEVLLECTIAGGPAPTALPDVVWRGGIDLNPLDVTDPNDLAWLEALIWPEHEERRQRLRAAARIVAADPPRVVTGDLNDNLASLAAVAPADATLVVFHTAVLTYLSLPDRARFANTVTDLDAVWLSNEGPLVMPSIRLPGDVEAGQDFLLARDGIPVALTGPHGQRYKSL